MSTTTLRTITGLILILHGIGHAMALLPALNIASTEKWHFRSWLLTGWMGDTLSRTLVIVLFGAAMIGSIAAGMGLLNWLVPHRAWPALAIASAVISLIALALFWNAFVTLVPNKIGAIAVNLATLVALFGSSAFSDIVKAL
jgi:hypothetical protein